MIRCATLVLLFCAILVIRSDGELSKSCDDSISFNIERLTHPACSCSRVMERFNYFSLFYDTKTKKPLSAKVRHNSLISARSKEMCPTPANFDILSASEILTVIHNKTIAIVGDSVGAQEECGLRCMLREHYIDQEEIQMQNADSKANRITRYRFTGGSSVFYVQFGSPWEDEDKLHQHRWKFAFRHADIVYVALGYHYLTNWNKLSAIFESMWNMYHHLPKPPLILLRLLSPCHFDTKNGLFSESVRSHVGCSPLNGTNLQDFRNQPTYRGMVEFADRHSIPYLNTSSIANDHRLHPRFHHGVSVHDCLHYAQDLWTLSGVCSAMVKLINGTQQRT